MKLSSVFMFHMSDNTLIVLLYVDDLVITRSSCVNLNLGFKKQLIDTFEMKDFDLLHFLWESKFYRWTEISLFPNLNMC